MHYETRRICIRDACTKETVNHLLEVVAQRISEAMQKSERTKMLTVCYNNILSEVENPDGDCVFFSVIHDNQGRQEELNQ
jgi:hypothetical protein